MSWREEHQAKINEFIANTLTALDPDRCFDHQQILDQLQQLQAGMHAKCREMANEPYVRPPQCKVVGDCPHWTEGL